MKRWMGVLIFLTAAAGLLAAGGCNDHSGDAFRPEPNKAVLPVEPGIWFVETTLAGSGTGCLPSVYDSSSMVFCDGIDLQQQAAAYGLQCTFQVTGDQVTANCSGDLTVANCTIHYTGGGRGSMSAGGRSFQMPLAITTTAGPECGGGTCNYTVAITGVWRAPGPCRESAPCAGERTR